MGQGSREPSSGLSSSSADFGANSASPTPSAAGGRRVTYRTEAARTLESGEGRLTRSPSCRGDGGGAGARLVRRDAGSAEAGVGPASQRTAGGACAYSRWDFARREASVFGLSGMRPSILFPACKWLGLFGLESSGERTSLELDPVTLFSKPSLPCPGVQAKLPIHRL